MAPYSHEEALRELARGLGRELPAAAVELCAPWLEKLERSGNFERDVANLARLIQAAQGEFLSQAVQGEFHMPAENRSQAMAVSPDDRGTALAEIMALDAARLPEVASFRQRVLRGRLLESDRVGAWIRRQAKAAAAGPAERRELLNDSNKPPLASSELLADGSRTVLTFQDDQTTTANVAVQRAGPLGYLKSLATWLGRRYSWSEAQAVSFVLTGRVPLLPSARVSVTPRSPFPARSTITLELSPRLKPADVAELYRKARSGKLFRGKVRHGKEDWRVAALLRAGAALPHERVKPMSPEQCELAVFIYGANDGRTWDAALAEWNRRHPKWKRANLDGFRRVAGEAYQRVTGARLEWRRARGRPPRSQ